MRTSYRTFFAGPKGKRTCGRPKRRWEDNIKMDLQETGCEDVELIQRWGLS